MSSRRPPISEVGTIEPVTRDLGVERAPRLGECRLKSKPENANHPTQVLKSIPTGTRSHFRVIGRSCAALLTALQLLAWPAVAAADSRLPAPFVPEIASFLGLQVGYATMPDLELRLGRGKPITGGHPGGARLWCVKGTSWVIHADAFEYSDRGIVVDMVEIYRERHPGRQVPYAHLKAQDAHWLGGISLGMSESRVLAVLQRRKISITKVDRGWSTAASGLYDLSASVRFTRRTTRLEFKEGWLRRITLDAQ